MVPKRERPPRLSGGGLDDPKAKEAPSPQRRGPRWSQNERGPLASAEGASVVPERRRPPRLSGAGRFLIEKKKKKQERLVTSHFYIVGTVVVISWWPLDGCCSFLVASGWLLFFPGGLWMVAVLSWWPLDGCCYFLVASGWLLLFPGGLWMVAVVSW